MKAKHVKTVCNVNEVATSSAGDLERATKAIAELQLKLSNYETKFTQAI